MSETLKSHHDNKNKVINLLTRLEDFITQAENVGISLPDIFRNKLRNSIEYLNEDKLRVVLIGGFSEGKTSIAAAWLGRIDPSSMDISAAESSDAVKIYDIDDQYQLIDTPGLYGFKEKINTDLQVVEKYKDITKKYVSEAHIVLYVMNSKNPIKESHSDDIKWLFKDLNLLPRTIFVLSRFDEVADVEDEDEYQSYLEIKQKSIKERLTSVLDLTHEATEKLRIVAVSANPFDEGIEYWLENKEEFHKLSHIALLQNATSDMVRENGAYQGLLEETRKSIISDILIKKLPEIEEKDKEEELELDKIRQIYTSQNDQLSLTKKKLKYARENLEQRYNAYFQDLIIQLNSASQETIADVLTREVGEQGIIISTKLQSIFRDETDNIRDALENQIFSFNAEVDNIDSAVGTMTKKGISHLAKNIKLESSTILALRDGLVTVANFVGINLKEVLKFKPWGAVNLAGNINSALPLAGIAIEAFDSWSNARKEEKFKLAIKDFIVELEQNRTKNLKYISSEKFISENFDAIRSFSEIVAQLKKTLDDAQKRKENLSILKKQALSINEDFRHLKN